MNNLLIEKSHGLAKKKKKGFTLVELVIVIAIIAILAAMAIPKLSSVRTDAKVSNDVAAAKNIQTQLAVEVSNNTITVPTSDPASSSAVPTDVLGKLDGKVGYTGKPETFPSGAFNYKVMANGNIVVYGNDGTSDHELYPDNDGTGRADFAKAAK